MIRKISTVFFLLILMVFPAFGMEESEKEKAVLIIYDGRVLSDENQTGFSNDFVYKMNLTMEHFNTKIDTMKISNYMSGTMLNYDYTFILKLKDSREINPQLIADLRSCDKEIVWYGQNVNVFLDCFPDIPIQYEGKSFHYYTIDYNGRSYDKNPYLGVELLNPEVGGVSTYGSVSNGLEKYPIVLNWKNIWIMSGLDTDEYLFEIFADVLHEVFKEKHEKRKKVYLRIEDVHPQRNPEKLKKIADYLEEENVPFAIALIPIYSQGTDSGIITIADRPEFAEVIRYMVNKGGSVILHGYAHKYHDEETGEGFEFWDSKKDAPIPEDIEEYVDTRIKKALKLLYQEKLYPIAFEAPHYAASQGAYKELSKFFSTLVGQVQTSDKRFISSTLPYDATNTFAFEKILPESLGYVEDNSAESIEKILDVAKRNTIIRDSDTGVFFHPYLNLKQLKELVIGLKSLNYEFADLKDLDNWVRFDGDITETNGSKLVFNKKEISSYRIPTTSLLAEENQLKEENALKDRDSFFNRMIIYIILLVAAWVVFFTIKYFIVRNNKRKRLFEKEK